MTIDISKKTLSLCLLCISVLGCSYAPRPQLGVATDSKLAPCPSSPNCVSSFESGDVYIDPILLNTPCQPVEFLFKVFSTKEHVSIVEQGENYLRVEFRSSLFGFIDDVEFLAQGTELQVRSASRSGYSDFGVNRNRIENIRTQLQSEC